MHLNIDSAILSSVGLIGSIANLSKLSDVHISNLSAGIFNQLSRYSEARVKMTERAAALSALLKLADSHEVRLF